MQVKNNMVRQRRLFAGLMPKQSAQTVSYYCSASLNRAFLVKVTSVSIALFLCMAAVYWGTLTGGVSKPDWLAFLLISAAVAVGATLQTSTGMGFALIAVPMIGLIDLAYLPGPFLFANLLLCTTIAMREYRALVLKELKPIAGGMILGSSLGALLLTQLPAEGLGVAFGLFILGAVILTFLSPKIPLATGNVLMGAVGSGLTGTAAAMHGPPLAMVYQHEKPEKARATLASAYVYGILLAFTTLHLTGRFGMAEVSKGLTLLPAVAVGYCVGRLLVGRISRKTARMAMLTISALGAVLLLAKSLSQTTENYSWLF